MSVDVDIQVKGVSELQQKLGLLGVTLETKVHDELQLEAPIMKNIARAKAPVVTGRLRDSIYAHVEGLILKLGATAPYAVFQELGTRYIKPKAFLQSAVFERIEHLVNRISRAIGDAIKEVSR
ncbi:MAG: hypothetical protein NUK63_03375 [Candidatus Bathyarchaeum tardum]|nr:MAG: hypothetical protein NUK63_03375 [Candidatus Bathyarchaeum tardum]